MILLLSGPSGSGKGTLIHALLKKAGSNLFFARSVTTRAPRPDPNDHYYYVSGETFQEMLTSGAFAEHTCYSGHQYGTLRSQLQTGYPITLVEVDVHGLMQLKGSPDLAERILSVFVLPPSADDLVRRLSGRGTEKRAEVIRRLSTALEELAYIGKYDHVLALEDPDAAALDLLRLVEGTPLPQQTFDMERFKSELQNYIEFVTTMMQYSDLNDKNVPFTRI